jgi:hypothetical protein
VSPAHVKVCDREFSILADQTFARDYENSRFISYSPEQLLGLVEGRLKVRIIVQQEGEKGDSTPSGTSRHVASP